MSLADTLAQLIEGEVRDDAKTLDTASEDTSIFRIRPRCVAFPKHTKDVQALVRYAREHPGEVSLTARAAGTDMSGGPLSDSVVVSFTEHFDRIIAFTEKEVVIEPGVYYRDFEPEAEKRGLLLPSYPASKQLNTVGGMVANNSAGEKSLTYGKTNEYVNALKVVLCDGKEYELKKLSRAQLEEKKALDTFEGELYREMERIIQEHHELLQQEKPTVSKNSAGYALWNVWDERQDTFDLTQLFVGSQGTLGFITEITFRLIEPKPVSRMAVFFLRPRHMKHLGELINRVLQYKPESFESYDDKTFNVMLRIFPKLFMRLGGNPFRLLRDFWPEIKLIVTGGVPKLVLMAEFTGEREEEVLAQAEQAVAAVEADFDVTTHITRSAKESEKYWTIRRESFKVLRENVRGRHTAPFIDDISVAPEHLPEFLPKLYDLLDEYELLYTVAGHVGDGNFHIIPLMDFSRADFADVIMELSDQVYTLVGEYDGSITGEHNDGLIRTPFLGKMFSQEMLAAFVDVKDLFDPDRIFNPHKKVDADMELLKRSIKRETPA